MSILVPSNTVTSGREAVRRAIAGAETVDVAVAFVSRRGVEILNEVLPDRGERPAIRIVVRGAPITDPEAVKALADLPADVRVVMGARASHFHPKLWIASNATGMQVLSGSGNLTGGGLEHNDEQFELLSLRLPADKRKATEHQKRWNGFFALGAPLAEAMLSPAWTEWTAQQTQRAELAKELKKLDTKLSRSRAAVTGDHDLTGLRQLLDDAVPGGYAATVGRHRRRGRVEVDVGDGRGFRYLFLQYLTGDGGKTSSPAITFSVYAGDTLTQARQLYAQMDQGRQDAIVKLQTTPGWSARPNFHLGFRNLGFLHDNTTEVELAPYLDYWRAHINEHEQKPAAEWPGILKSLAEAGIVSAGYPAQFDANVGQRSPVAPRPSVLLKRSWQVPEVEQMTRAGTLADAARDAVGQALAALGEPSL